MKKMDCGRKNRKIIIKVFIADLFMIEGIFTKSLIGSGV